MKKTQRNGAVGRQAAIGAQRLEHHRGAEDAGFQKNLRARDRPVDVAFCGEVHYSIGLIAREYGGRSPRGRGSGLPEMIAARPGNRRHRRQVRRIGERVDIFTTSWPRSCTRWRQTAEPMKPAPPVTKIRFILSPLEIALLSPAPTSGREAAPIARRVPSRRPIHLPYGSTRLALHGIGPAAQERRPRPIAVC